MVSTQLMLLFISSAGIRRAVGPSLASAFVSNAPSAVVSPSSATAAAQAWARQQQRPLSTARFMSTADAAAGEKTEEEQAKGM